MATLVRMTRDNRNRDEDVRQHSGWLIPLVVFVVTAGLSAMFLLFYLVPNPTTFIEEHSSLTAQTDPVNFTVGGIAFTVPSNYFMYQSAREGGERKDVSLVTLLPDFRGYTNDEADTFNDHSADSPVIYILLRSEPLNQSEAERLKRIYMAYVANPAGEPGPFGLTQYSFRDDSGYRGEDLFVGQTADGLAIMRCGRFSPELPSPSCLRDRRLAKGVVATYRFKRANLGQWHEIATGIDRLIAGFRARAK